jgi:hypothetical protein
VGNSDWVKEGKSDTNKSDDVEETKPDAVPLYPWMTKVHASNG